MSWGKLFTLGIMTLVFLIGWVSSALFFVGMFSPDIAAIPEIDLKKTSPLSPLTGLFVMSSDEMISPHDRVAEEQIKVYDDRVILLLDDPQWSSFTDTNSMDPFLDEGANAIEIMPKYPSDIHVGDVVSYRDGDDSVIHRVVAVDYDNSGVYYLLKGDNNPVRDSAKVRFDQIEGLLVAVVY